MTDIFPPASLNVTFTFVFDANGLTIYVTTCTLSSLSRRRGSVTSQRYTRHKAGCRTKHACSPDFLMVCVSCKIHSPRISPPAPCEGFSPSRVRTKTCSGVTRRKDVYPPSVRTKTPPELAQRITSG